MSVSAAVDPELQKRLELQKLATMIGNAPNLQALLAGQPTEAIAGFLNAERASIFVLDTRNNQLTSVAKSGDEVKEIRIEKQPSSLAGFTALSMQTLNIANVRDTQELAAYHPQLKFDDSWDQSTGFMTCTMLSVPVRYEKNCLGVMQVINRLDGESFDPRDVETAEELAQRLGMAFYNFNKVRSLKAKRTKWSTLVDSGGISEEALQKAIASATSANIDPARYLIDKVGLKQEEIEKALSIFYNCKSFRFRGNETIPDELRAGIKSLDYLKQICIAPMERKENQIVIVIDDPADLPRTDAVRRIYPDRQLVYQVALRDDILACIDRTARPTGDVSQILKDLSADPGFAPEQQSLEDETKENDSAIIKLVEQVIIDAYNRRASDIHIEPYGREMKTVIRFRVDGDCGVYQEIAPQARNALVARIKIMANLDIAEKRKPQDGKIRFRMSDRQIELRVATIPTVNGNEDVVMRILAASKPLPLDQMGMSPRNLTELKKIMERPYGLILCVGPTGSGKTTTLHSALGHINTPDMKIWTAEDPVEITQYGLRQVQVQAKIGFTFAAAMKAFLRADPDVIMVGEMRDAETAGTGIEASLTGHLVVSTLHTNSAPETITRLLDMELDPFSFADALLGVLAQRLARSICKNCRQAYVATKDEVGQIVEGMGGPQGLAARGWKPGELRLWRGVGCDACGGSGYKGRIGLHELLINNDDIKRAIGKRAPVDEIRTLALQAGMTTLLQDGIEKAVAGSTDLKQVYAVCSR